MSHYTGHAAFISISGINYILPELVAAGSIIAGLDPEDILKSPGSYWAILTCPNGCCNSIAISWDDRPKTRWEYLGPGRNIRPCENRAAAEAFVLRDKNQVLS